MTRTQRRCPECKKTTEQVYYDDWRPGAPNAYWQCSKCHECFHRCGVHNTWTADLATDAQRGCACRAPLGLDELVSA